MDGSRFTSVSPTQSASIDSTSHSCGPIVNPRAWTCLAAAIGFTNLAVLVVLMPRLTAQRGLLQISSLLIAITSIGLNHYLQATVFDEPASDIDSGSQTTIIDINRVHPKA